MAYPTLADYNTTTGIPAIFQYVSEVVPIFTPMLLLSFFVIAMLGSYFSQRRTTGRGNFKASFAVAGYLTVLVAFLLTLLPGVMDIITLSVTIAVAVLGTILLLTTQDN